jgi:hypothetical protein
VSKSRSTVGVRPSPGPVRRPDDLVHAETGDMICSYHRGPNRADLSHTWVRGRRNETFGKLRLVTARELAQLRHGSPDGASVALLSSDRDAVQAPNGVISSSTSSGSSSGLESGSLFQGHQAICASELPVRAGGLQRTRQLVSGPDGGQTFLDAAAAVGGLIVVECESGVDHLERAEQLVHDRWGVARRS